MKTPELLFTCPRCGKRGFTMRGLRSHWCRLTLVGKFHVDPCAEFDPRQARKLTAEELASATAEPQQANIL